MVEKEGNAGVLPQEGFEDSSGVNLLISILLRYPEIINVSFEPGHKTLGFTLMLRRKLDDREFEAFRRLMVESLKGYLALVGRVEEPGICLRKAICLGHTLIRISCDISLLTHETISLLVESAVGFFGEDLIAEGQGRPPEEDRESQDEVIENLLADTRDKHYQRSLIGFREDGRVLVFNRPISRKR